jgi:DNA-directed RNA polymerase II subunit RPB4
MDYLDHFARFKRKENVEAVERLLSAHQELAKFERAQLGIYHLPYTSAPTRCYSSPRKHICSLKPGSLCCELAEEAKTLIPSLADKISDEDLQELLNEISKHRGYDQ